MTHPVATAEQHAHELAALELIEHPTVRAAYADVAETWLGRAKASDAMRERFEAAYEEVMFSAAVWSSNQDPLRPKVTTITRLEHEVDGRRIPGTRWGIDNPDSVYRVIPISGDERYEIRGRVGAHRMTENYFTLWDANMGTVDVLDGRRMQVEDDGSFLITVDADAGRWSAQPRAVDRRRRTSSTSATCCSTGAATTPTPSPSSGSAARPRRPRSPSTSRPRRPRG